MPTLHIGPAVSEKTGTVNKGLSFIAMGDMVDKITLFPIECDSLYPYIIPYFSYTAKYGWK